MPAALPLARCVGYTPPGAPARYLGGPVPIPLLTAPAAVRLIGRLPLLADRETDPRHGRHKQIMIRDFPNPAIIHSVYLQYLTASSKSSNVTCPGSLSRPIARMPARITAQ